MSAFHEHEMRQAGVKRRKNDRVQLSWKEKVGKNQKRNTNLGMTCSSLVEFDHTSFNVPTLLFLLFVLNAVYDLEFNSVAECCFVFTGKLHYADCIHAKLAIVCFRTGNFLNSDNF